MSRRLNSPISARPSVEVNKKIIEARREQEADQAADHDQSESSATGSKGAGSKPGVSDSAASYQPGGVADGMTTPDAGPGSASPQEQATFVGAAPSGAQGAVAAAQGSVANGFAGGALTEGGREEVDVDDLIADAKAGMPSNQARESARSMLFEDAASGDGSTGIAEMGRGAMADGSNTGDKDKEATDEELARLAEKAKEAPGDAAPISTYGTSKEMPNGDIKTVSPDVGTVNLPGGAGEMVNQVNTTTHGRARQIDLATREDAPITDDEKPAAEKPATQPPAETPGLTNPPEDLADGSTLYAEDNWVSVHHPDGTTVTQTFADDGTVTTVTRDGHGKETGRTKSSYLEQPDPEDSGDRFRYVSEGLKERLGPKGVDGGGDIDYGDDLLFGVGANVRVPNTQGALLGDAGRLNGIDDGPATSGGGALDPSGNGGAIDYDDAPLGGGLEDDPLAGPGPQRDLDDVLGLDDDASDEDDTSDDTDTDDSVAS